MAKKSFKDNPAFQHLNTTNPVLNIINVPAEASEPAEFSTQSNDVPPPGYRMNPRFIEMRTARMLLALPPSLLEKIKASAKKEGVSNNEFVIRALEAYITHLK